MDVTGRMDLPKAERLPRPSNGNWILEREVVFLVLLVAGTYFTRLDALPIRGEESRRGFVAQEMQRTGDWIVPRYQGNAFFMSSRPPLQAWCIAASGWLRGKIDTVAVRIPSVVALLVLVLVIYGCARTFLSRLGALAAAAAYATMGNVLQLGRLGETDLLFTLFVSSSLLVWHAGYARKWREAATWSTAYLLVALGMLTKGPQAPVYFAASVGLYLLLMRDLRRLVSWGHATGLAVFVCVWGAWQAPHFLQMGVPGVRHIYLGDVAMYGRVRTWWHLWEHLLTYPAAILAGCLLPWSFLLLAYVRREFRARLGSTADWVMFLTCCLIATFPSVWLVTGARTRFYMPLFPCFAMLCGIVVEKCLSADTAPRFRWFWKLYVELMAVVIVGAGLAVLGVSLWGHTSLAAGIGPAVMFCLFALACAAVIVAVRRSATPGEGEIAVVTIATFIGVAFATVTTDTMSRLAINKEVQMARLMQRLPRDAKLYSFGAVDHAFGFYYGADIGHVHFPTVDTVYPADFEYFCFNLKDFPRPETLPFAWEPIGAVACGRNWDHELQTLVVVGRKTDAGTHPTAEDVVTAYRSLHGSEKQFRGLLAERSELPGVRRSEAGNVE